MVAFHSLESGAIYSLALFLTVLFIGLQMNAVVSQYAALQTI
jgi:hypothetical protein